MEQYPGSQDYEALRQMVAERVAYNQPEIDKVRPTGRLNVSSAPFNEHEDTVGAIGRLGTKKGMENYWGQEGLSSTLPGEAAYGDEGQAFWDRPYEKVAMETAMGGLGIIAGVGAKTANIKELHKARKMAQYGAPSDDIFEATGWFKGVDDKWKFEISDFNAELKIPKTRYSDEIVGWESSLGKDLTHPELFEAYPDLMNIHTKYPIGLKRGNASYQSAESYSNKKSKPEGVVLSPHDLWNDSGKTPALHEIQHALQGREGFAVGGNVITEASKINEKELMLVVREVAEHKHGVSFDKLPAEVQKKLKDEVFSSMAFNNYEKIAGEVEARAVEKRSYLTPEEAKVRPVWKDYDYHPNAQTVRFK